MSSNVQSTFWQRTLRAFLGDQVVIKLRGGKYLEGELKNPQANDVTLILPTGTATTVEYARILEVEAK